MRAHALAIVAAGLTLVLAACGSTPVPDIAYYQIAPASGIAARDEQPLGLPVVVDVFSADGLHGEQAILYALRPEGSVRAYHYQLWNDPPVRMLQRRLIARLRDENFAPLVADRLPASVASYRVSGVIEKFERVQLEDGVWHAQVRIEMRVDAGAQDLPALLKLYEADVAADGESIQATVRAFGAAVDDILGRFSADFATLGT
jgi:ABC-type uncharacterized transport system auxiliary subunit